MEECGDVWPRDGWKNERVVGPGMDGRMKGWLARDERKDGCVRRMPSVAHVS